MTRIADAGRACREGDTRELRIDSDKAVARFRQPRSDATFVSHPVPWRSRTRAHAAPTPGITTCQPRLSVPDYVAV